MFPEGGPGAGLLLLRLAVASSLLLYPSGGTVTQVLLILTALGLCVGVVTPVLAAAYGLLHLHSLLTLSDAFLPQAGISLLTAIALALLGPGAHSLDARLFGRRVVTLPPRKK